MTMNRIGPSGAIQLAMNKNIDGHGIFWQSKEKNKAQSKKIDYKSRKLRHPIRQPNEDEILAQMEAEKEEEKRKFNKNNKDFIKKNRERFRTKGQEQHIAPGETEIKPGTVTLTQEQLTALLASLGKTGAGQNSAMKIKIDAANNKIEMEQFNNNSHDNRNDTHEAVKQKRESADSDGRGEIGIGALLERHRSAKGESKNIQIKPNEMKEDVTKLNSGNTAALTPKQEADIMGVSWKHLTVAERKRLQWAREKAESQDEYNPWGKPGAGAPIRKQEEIDTAGPTTVTMSDQNTSRSFVDPEMKRKQNALAREIELLQKEIHVMEKKKKNEEEKLLRDFLEKQKVRERGEKEIKLKDEQKENGGEDKRQNKDKGDGQEELLSKKEEERKKWVAELDKQREEQRIKKQLEKERDKTGIQDQWADRFVYHKTIEQISPRHAQGSQKMGDENYAPIQRPAMPAATTQRPAMPAATTQGSPNNAATESLVPPAAMRSSMVVGTGSLNDKRYDEAKAEEKRKWLQELEHQREEQRLAKLAQKERDKQEDGTWADRYPSDHHKSNRQTEGIWKDPSDHNKSNRQNEGIWMDPYPSDHKKLHTVKEDDGGSAWFDPHPSDHQKLHPDSDRAPHRQDQQRTNSAPSSTLPPLQTTENTEVSSFLRGQGAFIDPVTRKEQEEKRKAQLAYQAEVKAQIDEKERKKKEERMRKMQEDMEEERKLQMERDVMNKQTEFEMSKLRQREELRQKQIAVLKTAMDEAQEKAMEEKNERRLNHLQQLGHDVSQLKAKYGAVSPRKKEFDMSSIPGLGNNVLPENLHRKAGHSSPPSYPVANFMTSRTDQVDPSERNFGQNTYRHEPYVEDRMLTPSRFRDPGRPRDLSDSPRREFGTQTLELKDLKALLEKLPEVQIEFKMKVEEALREKESEKQAPPRKVHTKVTEESIKDVKKATAKGAKSAPKEKIQKINERPDWNQRKRKTVVKNSEKDPFYEQKREEAETRRLKRERQLMYLQELNKERIPNLSKSPGRSPRDPSPEAFKQIGERGRKPGPAQKSAKVLQVEAHRDPSPNVLSLLSEKGKKNKASLGSASPPIPSVKHKSHAAVDPGNDPYNYINSYLRNSEGDTKYGDVPLDSHGDEFLPFMRTTEVLDPSRADEPVEISRENSRMERARRSYYENLHPANKGKKIDIYQDSERESVLKVSQNKMGATYVTPRQDMILQQLSSLKKTLMQRQKELEDYMLPSELEHEALRG
ncbi:hypothetical protein Btru_052697 [Bulinus truncatus]|nr:hypothetical protein Btru_052697 [Bulinus truncatus]